MDKKLLKATNDRTLLIDNIIKVVENKVTGAQDQLVKSVVTDIVDGLDQEGGKIKNTLRNKRMVALIDNVFTDVAKGKGLDVAASVLNGVSRIIDFNGKYYDVFSEPAKLGPISDNVKESLGAWLGLNKKGGIEENGYLNTLIQDPTIKNAVKDLVVKNIVSQNGYNETKADLKNFIAGNSETGSLGAMQKYYRNFVYDTFSQVDRTSGKLYADKLGFNYAIYEGGLIETSRIFCKERNGKVFSKDEIAQFDPPEAKPPGYNPFFDLGGYSCRHHLNWIPDNVAFALRPELKNQTPPTKTEIKEAENPKTKTTPPAAAEPTPGKDIQAPRVSFEEAKIIERKTFNVPTGRIQKDLDELEKLAVTRDKLKIVERELLAKYNKLGKDFQTNHPTPETMEARRAELKKGWEDYSEHIKKTNELKEKEAPIKNRIKKEFHAEILNNRPKNKFSVNVTGPTLKKSGEFMGEVPAAVEFFRVASHGWIRDDLTMDINQAKGDRAYYSNGSVYLTKSNKAKIVLHEFGHFLEEHNQVFKNTVDFLHKRTEGQTLTRLSTISKGYGRTEVFKPGGFPNPYDSKFYAGNRYRGLQYTEIVSRGLEYMYDDPAEFYRKDKDYFNFIYSMFF